MDILGDEMKTKYWIGWQLDDIIKIQKERVKALNAIKTAKGSLSDYERGVLNTLASLVPYLGDISKYMEKHQHDNE